MANGWTDERRARHAELIQRWKPWERSSGPKTAEGKATVSRNAYQGGTRPALRQLAHLLADLWSQRSPRKTARTHASEAADARL